MNEIKAGQAFIQLVFKGGKALRDSVKKVDDSLTGKFKGIFSKIDDAGKKLGLNLGRHFGTIAIGAALYKLTQGMRAFVAEAEKMRVAAAQTGIAIRDLSLLELPLSKLGISMEQFADAMKDFQRKSPFQGSQISQIKQAADELQRMGDVQQRATRAMELFGEQGYKLLPFLSQGADGIERMMAESDALGISMSHGAAEAAKELADAGKELSAVISQMYADFVEDLGPAISKIIKLFATLVKYWNFAREGGRNLNAAIFGEWRQTESPSARAAREARDRGGEAFQVGSSRARNESYELKLVMQKQLAEQRRLREHFERARTRPDAKLVW